MSEDLESVKDVVDYTSIIFRQIDRCGSSDKDRFPSAVERLMVLCKPFNDNEYEQRLNEINKSFKEELSAYKRSYDELMELYKEHIAYPGRRAVINTDLARIEAEYKSLLYDRAILRFKCCVDLLDRKGVIIERLRAGIE